MTTPKSTKSSALKAYLDAGKKDTVVLGAIERHLLTLPRDRSRRQDVLHPSEVTKSDWCIRRTWMVLHGAEAAQSNPNLRLSSIFAEGHAIHSKWQGWLESLDLLVGVWECPVHGPWWGKRSELCTDHHVDYREVPVRHDDLVIAGHADGWLTTGHLLEIKSIGTGTLRMGGVFVGSSLEEGFGNLNRPLVGHVRQAMLYLYCLKWMYIAEILPEDYVPPDKILFIYECKANQEAKEFVVEYDETYLEPFLEKRAKLDLDSEEPPACTGGSKCDCGELTYAAL
jgi:hypothetical protein